MGNVISFAAGAAAKAASTASAAASTDAACRRTAQSISARCASRGDTGAAVGVQARPERVTGDPRIRALVQCCLAGAATPEEARLFGTPWQDRVRRRLAEDADDPEVIVVTAAGCPAAATRDSRPAFARVIRPNLGLQRLCARL